VRRGIACAISSEPVSASLGSLPCAWPRPPSLGLRPIHLEGRWHGEAVTEGLLCIDTLQSPSRGKAATAPFTQGGLSGFYQPKRLPLGGRCPEGAEGETKNFFTIHYCFILHSLSPRRLCRQPPPRGGLSGFCLPSLPPGGEGGPKGRMRGQSPFGIMLFSAGTSYGIGSFERQRTDIPLISQLR